MYVGNHNPTERYIEAKAAFETAKVGNARLTGWADLYVNSEGWKMFRSRIRTQKRKDSRSGGQVLRVREFTDATIKELHEVRINISEKKTFNLDETLKYLIDFWKNN